MELSLFAIGDVHLGRRPSRLPGDLSEHHVDPAELSPKAAWRRAVEAAIEREVDCVLLTGDVVESDNHWFEAYYHLESGVRRLVDAGIGVYAVAGNHDVEALPRLARAIEGFHLLGRGGRWELVRHADRLELLGWSFPERRVLESPLRELSVPSDHDVPRIGLLHADLDAADSPYAPVAREELARAPVDAWLLGHVHAPSLATVGGRPTGYLGSLSPLDPTERGMHGPWLLRWTSAGFACEHLPLAPLRWEQLDVDVGDWVSAHDLEAALPRALLALAEDLDAQLDCTRALGVRIRLTGRTRISRELREFVANIHAHAHLRREVDGTLLFVERITPAWRVDCDLESLASGADAPGLLARRLMALQRGDSAADDLIAAARESMRRSADARPWLDLQPADLRDDDVRELLATAAEKALEELLAQGEAQA